VLWSLNPTNVSYGQLQQHNVTMMWSIPLTLLCSLVVATRSQAAQVNDVSTPSGRGTSGIATSDIIYYATNWRSSETANWTRTDPIFQKSTGITLYRVYEQKSLPRLGRWKVEVEIASGWCRFLSGRTYKFRDSDQPPDTYSLSCHVAGKHSVAYSAENPTIHAVGVEI
jgi:hypothetical protein